MGHWVYPQYVAVSSLADHLGSFFSAPTVSLANDEMELSASSDLRILLHDVTRDCLPHRDNQQAGGNEDPRMADSLSSHKTVFACFAHPDDEVGALGTLANHGDRGDRVVLAWMTCGENTSMSKAKSPAEVARERRVHGQEVGKIIGCEVAFFDYGDTQVQLTRDAAVQMGRFIAELKPDAIITWDSFNSHPDHRETAKIIMDAVRFARLPRLVEPHTHHRLDLPIYQFVDNRSHDPIVYVDVSEQIDKILKAVAVYSEAFDWTNVDERVRVRRASIGMKCGVRYAEQFTVRRRMAPPQSYLV
jgi:N-acetylglucosamine malate deacetylase 1